MLVINTEDLRENILNLKIGREYIVYRENKRDGRVFLQGVFLGETGIENELYLFKSNYGFKECFLKIDFVIGEYNIKKAKKTDSKPIDNFKKMVLEVVI